MDSAPLVNEDIEIGASLVEALREADVPVELAGWVYDREQQAWRLVVATVLVDEIGSLGTYKQIGDVANEQGVGTSFLTRVTVASPSDPVIGHLRLVKQASELSGPEFPVLSGVDLPSSGRSYLYIESGIAYDKGVMRALQRVTPPHAVVRRAERLYYADPGFDFVVADGERQVLIEAKATSRPLGRAHMRSLTNTFRERPPLLVLSNHQVSASALQWLQDQPGIHVVTWRGPEDDDDLRRSLHSLLASPPSSGAAAAP